MTISGAATRALRHARGFTLLEVLVAMALLAVVVGAAATTQQLAWKSASSATRAIEQADAEARAFRLVAGVFALASLEPDRAALTELRRDRVLLVSRVPAASGRAGDYWIELAWSSRGEGSVLRLRGWPFAGGGDWALPSGQPEFDRPLLDSVADGRFEFAAAARWPNDAQWVSAWARSDTYPELVRLVAQRSSGHVVSRVIRTPRVRGS